MQINVITGPQGSGKTTKLEKLATPKGYVIIPAPEFTSIALVRTVMARIEAGDTCILIDDCSPEQIKQLHVMKQVADAANAFSHLTIHVAQQAME